MLYLPGRRIPVDVIVVAAQHQKVARDNPAGQRSLSRGKHMRTLYWKLVLLAVAAGCSDPAADTVEISDQAVVAENSVKSDSVTSNDSLVREDTTFDAGLALEGEGLRIFILPSGSARPIPFGTPSDEARRILTAVLDQEPVEQGENVDCGIDYARWENGLLVVFAGGEFAGWSVGRGSRLTTASGIGLGSTRAELESVYAAQIEPSTLGIEFTAGDLAGVLDSPAQDAPIIALWAGIACLAR
ncbi:MAG TPA: hypothetical protein VFI91_06200 [Longimicrobiaceae bacterium]|nr:hypothetical protein [Longimicrobiaceae bacterium]